MKVWELIDRLETYRETYGEDFEVLVNGYEGGYDDRITLTELKINRNVHPKEEWWYGPHDIDYQSADEGKELVVVIGRGSRK